MPDLYLLDDVPSGIAAIPTATPGTALGPQVRSGMTVQQLAFLAGRHLAYYRPERYALVFFPTLADVSSLVLAAVRLVIPSITVPPPMDAESRVPTDLGSRQRMGRIDAVRLAVGGERLVAAPKALLEPHGDLDGDREGRGPFAAVSQKKAQLR